MNEQDQRSPEEAEISLAEAFTIEHHQIDAGIEAYLADRGQTQNPRHRGRQLLTVIEALRRHIYLEEEIVFPRLVDGSLMMALMVMRREHGELWQRMDLLTEIWQDESGDPAEIEQTCTQILNLLDKHNSKEEPIVYPHIDADLEPAEQDLVRELLSGGSMPKGWICEVLR